MMLKKFRYYLLVVWILAAILLFAGCGDEPSSATAGAYADKLVINELMPKNKATLMDENGDFCDWVELKNISGAELSLSGWALSDREGEVRWSISEKVLAPDELLLVYLGGDESSPLHANFSLSDGETFYLIDPEGTAVSAVSCPNAQADTAFAWDAEGQFSPVRYASPGYPNTDEGYDAFCAASSVSSPLIINEVMTGNLSYHSPYPTVTCDWVEVKNVSRDAIELSDFYLSDDDDDFKLWRFPAVTLESGECMAVYCSGDVTQGRGINYHCPFSLDALNEQLFLSDAKGNVVDYVHLYNIPTDYSYGRISGKNGFFYISEPTLSADNGESGDAMRRISEAPVSLTDDGVFNGVKELSVELSGRGKVYYTLDGSVPTAESERYIKPLKLSKTTVVRAVAIQDGAYASRPLTQSYIINEEHTLPVLSLVVDNEPLFQGVYRNGKRDIFIQANLALYEDGGGFSSPCGVTMKGWTSLSMPKKSLGVYFKGIYGVDMLNCDIFGNGISEYSSLSIRAGQDYDMAIIRNELFQELCLDVGGPALSQESKYCVLYVNGEYYGLYCLKEDFSRQYYASHTGVSKDSVEMIKSPAPRDSEFFTKVVAYAWAYDPTTKEFYNTLAKRLDMDSLIDWFIIEGYSANVDIQGNVRFFRSGENGNLWQFALCDLDWAFYHSGSSYVAIFEDIGNVGNQAPEIVNALLRNDVFREKFLIRFSELMDTTLSNENVLKKIDSLAAQIEPEVPRDRERWNIPVEGWSYCVNNLRRFVTENDLENKVRDVIALYLDMTDEEKAEYFDIH